MSFQKALATLHEDGPKAGIAALGRLESLSAAQADQIGAALDGSARMLAAQPALALKAARLLVEAGATHAPRFLIDAAEAGYEEEASALMYDQPLPENALMNVLRELEARAIVRACTKARVAGDGSCWRELTAPAALRGDSDKHMAAQLLRRVDDRARDLADWMLAQRDAPAWVKEGIVGARGIERSEGRRTIWSLVEGEKWREIAARAPTLAERFPEEAMFPYAIARAHRAGKRLEEAVTVCEAGLARQPGSVLLVLELVTDLGLSQQHARAIAEWRARRKRLERDGQAENVGTLLQNLLASFAAAGRAAEGIRELEREIEECGSDAPLFNAACVSALAKDLPRTLAYVERLRAAGRDRADFDAESDFDGVRDSPAFREQLERDFTGTKVILADLGSDDLAVVQRGLAAFRSWVETRGHDAELSLLSLEPTDGSGELLANPLLDELLVRHGKSLGRDALLDLVAALFGEASRYHDQQALKTAVLLLLGKGRRPPDAPLEEALVKIFLRGMTYVDDGHRSFAHTALDFFIDEVFPRFSGAALADLLIALYDVSNHRDVLVLLPLALSRKAGPQSEAALLDRVTASLRDGDGFFEEHIVRDALSILDDCIDTRGVSKAARARLADLTAAVRAQPPSEDS